MGRIFIFQLLFFNWAGMDRAVAALSRVFSFKKGLAYAAHEFLFLGCGAEDELLVFGLDFSLKSGDGQLQAMVFVLAERIGMTCGQPFRNHLDVLEGSVFVVVLIDIGGDGSGAFVVFAGTNQRKFLLLSFGNEFGDDVEHRIVPFHYMNYVVHG